VAGCSQAQVSEPENTAPFRVAVCEFIVTRNSQCATSESPRGKPARQRFSLSYAAQVSSSFRLSAAVKWQTAARESARSEPHSAQEEAQVSTKLVVRRLL